MSRVILLLYLIFFTGVIFSFRAVSSIAIGLILLAGIIHYGRNSLNKLRAKRSYIIIYGLYFLFTICWWLLNDRTRAGSSDMQLKGTFLVIPAAVLLSFPAQRENVVLILRFYCLVVLIASLYCLGIALYQYMQYGDYAIFFYHQLVGPLNQHAVYFSIYTFIALSFLLDDIGKAKRIFKKNVTVSMIVFFSLFIFLLSSKLVLVLYVLYLLLFLWYKSQNKKRSKKAYFIPALIILAFIIAGSVIKNPVRDRFFEMATGDPALAQRESFDPGIYFNSVQFRLLQWKLVPGILNDHDAWPIGVGPVKAQHFLDKEYINRAMWPGEPGTNKKGYRGYNTHNQLLESILRYGIMGLVLFLLILGILVRAFSDLKFFSYRAVILLLFIYSLVESVFETQYGILLISFFPLFLMEIERSANQKDQ